MIYKKVIKKILFLFDPEISHNLTLKFLKVLDHMGMLNLYDFLNKNKNKNIKFQNSKFTLNFKNKLGLAAGLDKNGDYLSPLRKLGFGFLEIGTVTPRPQIGNPKPRLFRLIKQEAIINRMGFNNLGIDYLINNVKKFKSKNNNQNIILGINIGKNFDTPMEPVQAAIKDYLICLEKAYTHADYISINISSPNTANLRLLQQTDYLEKLLKNIKQNQLILNTKFNSYKPLALKIAPDLDDQQIADICNLCIKNNIDILIVTNTTNDHELLFDKNNNKIAGGLSGRPLYNKSNSILNLVVTHFKNNNYRDKIIIIAVGGINSASDAEHKLALGADLVQIYTGLVYQGPSLINQINSLH